jgi:hypothetical protein
LTRTGWAQSEPHFFWLLHTDHRRLCLRRYPVILASPFRSHHDNKSGSTLKPTRRPSRSDYHTHIDCAAIDIPLRIDCIPATSQCQAILCDSSHGRQLARTEPRSKKEDDEGTRKSCDRRVHQGYNRHVGRLRAADDRSPPENQRAAAQDR